jgi:hypothetical protein
MRSNLFLIAFCLVGLLLAGVHFKTQLDLKRTRDELRVRQGLSTPEMLAIRGWGIVIRQYCDIYASNDEVMSRLAVQRMTCTELLPFLRLKSHINPKGVDFQKNTMISRATWKHIENYAAFLVGSEALLGRLIIESHSDGRGVTVD